MEYRVGFYQFRPRFGKPEANLEKVVEALSSVKADLVVLPELPFTGYLFKDRRELRSLAEDPRDSAIVSGLAELCRKRSLHLVTGFAELAGGRIFNSSLLVGPRGILQTYRKIHLFKDEKKIFDPGDTAPAVRRVRGVRIGMLVCFDWVFPEITRALALQGMDLLCHPSNLVLKNFCQQAMTTRCIENSIYAVTANRFGEDRRPHGSVRFTGRSQIVAPRGEVIYRAAGARNDLHVETLDISRARDKMITDRNHLLRDRRPEFYP